MIANHQQMMMKNYNENNNDNYNSNDRDKSKDRNIYNGDERDERDEI